jgi:hypothetical protein
MDRATGACTTRERDSLHSLCFLRDGAQSLTCHYPCDAKAHDSSDMRHVQQAAPYNEHTEEEADEEALRAQARVQDYSLQGSLQDHLHWKCCHLLCCQVVQLPVDALCGECSMSPELGCSHHSSCCLHQFCHALHGRNWLAVLQLPVL